MHSAWAKMSSAKQTRKQKKRSSIVNLRGDDIIRDANELLQKANDRQTRLRTRSACKRNASDRVRLKSASSLRCAQPVPQPCGVIIAEPSAGVPEGTAASDAEQAEPAAEESEPAAAAQPRRQRTCRSREAEPAQPAQEDAEPAAVVEDDDDKAADSSEDFWAKDELPSWTRRPRLLLILSRTSRLRCFSGVKFSE